MTPQEVASLLSKMLSDQMGVDATDKFFALALLEKLPAMTRAAGLKPYTVIYENNNVMGWRFYRVWALNGDDAEERCQQAHADATVLWVNEGTSTAMEEGKNAADGSILGDYTCPNCGKGPVLFDAYSVEIDGQKVLYNDFDATICDNCGSDSFHPRKKETA